LGLKVYHGKMLAVFFSVFVVLFILLHSIPLPGLLELTASGSASVLGLLGVDAGSSGAVVYVNGFPEAVIIPACTGIDSISLLSALAVADPYLNRKRRISLMAIGIPVLFAANFFRVAVTLISPSWFPAHFVLWMASAFLVFVLWSAASRVSF